MDDFDAVAKGWIDLLDDDDRTVLAFGMLPHEKFEYLMKRIYLKKLEAHVGPGGVYEGCDPEELIPFMNKEYKRKLDHDMTVAIYRNAKMVV